MIYMQISHGCHNSAYGLVDFKIPSANLWYIKYKGFLSSSSFLSIPTGLPVGISNAVVAQWQSNALVMRRLVVRLHLAAPIFVCIKEHGGSLRTASYGGDVS